MTIGTKSLLFGVHQIFFHPLTVALAWRKLYRAWPSRYELCAIFFHDFGYFGKWNIDGEEGKLHPIGGARIAAKAAYLVARLSGKSVAQSRDISFLVKRLSLLHSRDMANGLGVEPSKLCWADKFCCYYDPTYWYLLRGHLSGEIYEFKINAIRSNRIPFTATDAEWYLRYRSSIFSVPEIRALFVR